MNDYEYRVMFRHYDGTVAMYQSALSEEGALRAYWHRADDDREWWVERRPLGDWERVTIGGTS